jgi:hypothetical protein
MMTGMAEKPKSYGSIYWLPKEEYDKAIGQFGLQVGGILSVFDLYGLGVFIPQAQEEIKKLAEDFSLRVRGVDKPISLEEVRRRK